MQKFFVCSDIHAFYDEWIDALEKAGFDWDDESHWLVVCGDYFDRGPKPIEVMTKLMSYPRAILVKGNHELLFEEVCARGYFGPHDYHNGTAQTILDLSGEGQGLDFELRRAIRKAYARVGVFFDKMVPYFETKNYVFCHGWVPVWLEQYGEGSWHQARYSDWEECMWENGMRHALNGDILDDKTIVCGHYHTSWGHHKLNPRSPEFDEGANFEPFYYKGCIAIDGCTAATKKVNVIVLEDDFIDGKEHKNGDEATEACISYGRQWGWEDDMG